LTWLDPNLVTSIRAACYLALIFLIVYDLPFVSREHRVHLFAMLLWLLALFLSVVALAGGNAELYAFIRDYFSTVALLLVVLAHLYWINKRGKT
jgi:hypothetical protein